MWEVGQQVYVKSFGSTNAVPAVNEGVIVEVGKSYVVIDEEFIPKPHALRRNLRITKSSYGRIIPVNAETLIKYGSFKAHLLQYEHARTELIKRYNLL